MEEEDIMRLYKMNYFPSESRFYEILKENGIKRTHKEVINFIENQALKQVFQPIVKRVKDLKPIVAFTENEQMQMDLLDYSKYKTSNKYFSWILIGIDIYTRKAYAEPLKTKSPNDVLEGFKKMNVKPLSITHDDGKEYLGAFKSYLKEQNIDDNIVNSKYHNTLGLIDRFSKTIKTIIEKNFTDNNSANWISHLPDIVKVYNNSPHSGINNIKPNKANEEENKKTISNINFWKAVKNNEIDDKKIKIKVGDYVRIQTKKTNLSKGYTSNYSKNV
jgi:hypothetical protein